METATYLGHHKHCCGGSPCLVITNCGYNVHGQSYRMQTPFQLSRALFKVPLKTEDVIVRDSNTQTPKLHQRGGGSLPIQTHKGKGSRRFVKSIKGHAWSVRMRMRKMNLWIPTPDDWKILQRMRNIYVLAQY